jgi:prepilin-type N-terminal cleavage/methylation domain-containing protein
MNQRIIRRRGFTLNELLVVIAIIGVLAALTSVAVFGLIGTRTQRNTETAMQTVNKALQQHWSFVVAEAKKDTVPDTVKTLAGGDMERARVIWTKLRLAEAFPQSYAEINDPANGVYIALGASIPNASRKYSSSYKLASKGLKVAKDPTTESGACLLMALSVSRGGNQLSPDSLSGGIADTDGDGLKEFVDGWGKAIAFFRFPTNNAALQAANPAPAGSKGAKFADPIDPNGTLLNPSWTGATAFETTFHKIAASPGVAFYVIPTLVSAGKDGQFGLNADLSVNNSAQSGNNVYSFNLRAE